MCKERLVWESKVLQQYLQLQYINSCPHPGGHSSFILLPCACETSKDSSSFRNYLSRSLSLSIIQSHKHYNEIIYNKVQHRLLLY